MYRQITLPLCIPEVDDEVFYVRKWNPIKGKAFDRYAILKKKIKQVGCHYFVADDGEILHPSRTFSDLEIAIECILELQNYVELAF